ncbi:MAG: lytic transglycosylase domain-containing protein [Planctomycetota bacterium]|nr:lytic transglycosylase domain-containing protein [Planctomycetota bacterium]
MTIRLPAAILLLVAVIAAGAWLGWRRASDAPDLSRWDAEVGAAAREFGLDADLLRGLMAAESGGDPEAVSHAGAVGLLQLMPATAEAEAQRLRIGDYAEARLTEGALNVRLGASYLARMLKRFDGEVPFALAAYNAGPSRVLRWREAAPDVSAREVIEREGFEETRRHLARTLRFRAAYAKRSRGSP